MDRIFEAAAQGNEDAVSRLLDGDPTLMERQSPQGMSLLACAAQAGQVDVVKLLVWRGAKIEARYPTVLCGWGGHMNKFGCLGG